MVGGWAESVGVRVRASGLRHEAGAAQHASAPLSTLSERSAPSDTLRNARPSPQATRRCGCHRAPLDQALTHPQIVRAAAHVRGCWCRLLEWLPDVCSHTARCRPTRRGAYPWPPHPIRVVDMGETARTSCDRRSCLWQPLTRSCLRHPCVRRRRHESAPHGWCCSARITDALHAERTHGSIACAAESERVPHVQHHHPCPPSAARRSLDGAVRVGVGV